MGSQGSLPAHAVTRKNASQSVLDPRGGSHEETSFGRGLGRGVHPVGVARRRTTGRAPQCRADVRRVAAGRRRNAGPLVRRIDEPSCRRGDRAADAQQREGRVPRQRQEGGSRLRRALCLRHPLERLFHPGQPGRSRQARPTPGRQGHLARGRGEGGRRRAGERTRPGDGAGHDGRRHRPNATGLHRQGDPRGHNGHGHRLRPPGSRWLLRPRLPRRDGLRLRRRRLQRGLHVAFLQPRARPDPDPDDCNGHGTHVAGIVGANGAVKGLPRT